MAVVWEDAGKDTEWAELAGEPGFGQARRWQWLAGARRCGGEEPDKFFGRELGSSDLGEHVTDFGGEGEGDGVGG